MINSPEKELPESGAAEAATVPQVAAPDDAAADGGGDGYDFDVFISYATDPDYKLARELESFVEMFHRLPMPENVSLGPLKVCVDGSDFRASSRRGSDGVGAVIESYLAKSKALLVLCSKNAHKSPWVDKELRWFLAHRDANDIMVAVTEGETPEEFAEVFPPAVVEAGLDRQIAYDFRAARRAARGWRAVRDYEDERTRLAADLYDRPAGEIRPIWFREQRRQTRNRTRLFAGIAVVLAALLAATFYFYRNAEAQRQNALAEAERARRQSYVASVNFARTSIEEGNAADALQLLEAQKPAEGQEDLRDFEWWHLLRRASAERESLFIKDAAFWTVAASADGSLVAAAGISGPLPFRASPDRQQQSIFVWTLPGGELRILEGHAGPVNAVAFSPSSRALASAGKDGLRVWDADSGGELRWLRLPEVWGLAFSPDGRTLAATHNPPSSPSSITLLDTETWERTGEVVSHRQARLRPPSFSPDGRLLAAGCVDGDVHVWDVSRRREVAMFDSHDGRVMTTAWSRGNLLATGGTDGYVVVWDMNTRKELASRSLPEAVFSLAFSADGALLAVGSGDPSEVGGGGVIRLWDVATMTQRGTLRSPRLRFDALAFAPDGATLFSAGGNSQVGVWDVGAACYLSVFGQQPRSLRSLAFSRDERLLAAGGDDGRIHVWALDGGAPAAVLGGDVERADALAFAPDGRLVSFGSEGSVRLWELKQGAAPQSLHRFRLPRSVPGVLCFSPDGTRLAAANCGGEIRLWEWPSLRPLGTLNQKGCVSFMAWSPDGRHFVTGGGYLDEESPLSVFVWREGEAAPRKPLEGHGAWPTAATFSPDGARLVTGDSGGELLVWDFPSGEPLGRIRGHAGAVKRVAYSRLGRVFVSAGADGVVRVWDAVTFQSRAVLQGEGQEFNDIDLHPGGKVLGALASSGGGDGVMLWAAADSTPRALAPQP